MIQRILPLLLISTTAMAMETDIKELIEQIDTIISQDTAPAGILTIGETRTGKTYVQPRWMGLDEYTRYPYFKENPADRFASCISHLPPEKKGRAWGHFWQRDYLCKGRMTLKDAEDLALLYTQEEKRENHALYIRVGQKIAAAQQVHEESEVLSVEELD